jgi:hypothetical protein
LFLWCMLWRRSAIGRSILCIVRVTMRMALAWKWRPIISQNPYAILNHIFFFIPGGPSFGCRASLVQSDILSRITSSSTWMLHVPTAEDSHVFTPPPITMTGVTYPSRHPHPGRIDCL